MRVELSPAVASLASLFCLYFTGLGPAAGAANQHATLVVVGGRVWTGDDEKPWAEAVGVHGDKILTVGSRQEIERLVGPNTKVIDAAEGLVTPGWIDSHLHLFQGGSNLRSVQLRDARTKEEFVKRIAAYVAEQPPGAWVTGGDWDHTLWGGELPSRHWIDSVSPDNPVWIQRLDGHMALANSEALRLAGVGDDARSPEGGAVERGEDGRITGLLRDNAMSLVESAVPPASTQQLLGDLAAATEYLHRNGVTAVGHMGSLEHLRVLRAASATGQLKIRVNANTPLSHHELLTEDIRQNGRGDDWLRAGGLKGFVDGSLGSHTAAFLDPYSDRPSDRGLLVSRPDDLYEWTSAADRAGLAVRVHAIGDRAVRLQLDIFERVARENGPRDRRFQIEHAQHLAPAEIPRFAELGVTASMQPYHAVDDGRWAEGVIGSQRCQTTYAFRSLLDSGARLAFGSDWYVAPATPLEGIDASVHRRTLDGANPQGWVPDQKISPEEALRAYTVDAAFTLFREGEIGSLRAGHFADLVVVDRDFLADSEVIESSKVRFTIVGGKIVYQSDQRSETSRQE